MPRTATDWTGYRYSFLEILGPSTITDSHGRRKWNAKCVCGQVKPMDIRDIRERERKNLPTSCGCKRGEFIAAARRTHGMSKHPAYGVWHSMVQRCTEPTHRAWKNYGGRGITVCERWLHSFENFWTDMGPTYSPGLELDRRENEKGYSPENCRWVTRKLNTRNQRRSKYVEYEGQRVNASELAERLGINYTTLLYRLEHDCPVDHLADAPDVRNRFTMS